MDAEGWYRDPFRTHELRWFSTGRPTAIVSDQGVEGSDTPPAPTWDGPLLDPDEGAVTGDFRRVGAPDPGYDPEAARDAASVAFDMSAGAM